MIGLPAESGKKEATLSQETLLAALLSADEQRLRGIFTSWYLSSKPLTRFFDEGLGPAFQRIGEMWQSGEIEVYQERQSAELCRRALYELISLIPDASDKKTLALGAGLRHDPYELANLMVEAALREVGRRSETLGVNLPGDTIAKAVATRKPQLLWLSVSSVAMESNFVTDCEIIWQACLAHQTKLAVGGRGLTNARRAKISYTVHCDRIGDLIDFLKSNG
nr:B12-binding domain-containing protein [Acanthopleuribacter pedis]